nr:hypothetical protein [Tanacetum cinerariifolium]
YLLKRRKVLMVPRMPKLNLSRNVPAVYTHDPVGVPAAPSIPTDASLPTASSSDPAAIPILAVSIAHATVFVPAKPMVDPAEYPMDPPLTAPVHGSSEPTVAVPSPSSSRHCRKHLAKKRVTPIMDVADAAMIKFDSDSDRHTKHFTTLREILHMVERTDLQRLLSAVDALYQLDDWDTFALLLWGDLHVLFQSLDDADALHFWRTQDSWRIRSWRLYLRAQVHVLEMVDGRVIHMFVDISYPLSVGFSCWFLTTLQMVFCLPWLTAKKELTHHEGTTLEQTALGKDQSNPLIDGSLLKTTWSSIHHILIDEVLTSPEQTAIGKDVSNLLMAMMVFQKPLGYFSSPMIHVPRADWFLIHQGDVLFPPKDYLAQEYVVPAGSEHSHSCCYVSAGKHGFCCQ